MQGLFNYHVHSVTDDDHFFPILSNSWVALFIVDSFHVLTFLQSGVCSNKRVYYFSLQNRQIIFGYFLLGARRASRKNNLRLFFQLALLARVLRFARPVKNSQKIICLFFRLMFYTLLVQMHFTTVLHDIGRQRGV